MTTRTSQATVPLTDDVSIPLIGFGTWQLEDTDAYNGVRAALEIGYRHIDTATGYSNEGQVGAAIRDSGIGRENIFITTKFPPENVGRERETIDDSLKLLGVDFVDLWLVHWPPAQARPETWKALIEALEQGKSRSIGVSNYSIAQIDELTAATGKTPALNQIPWNPFAYDTHLVDELASRHVVLEGYSPLKLSDLSNPALGEIAASHGKTPAQVILRWHVEHGFVVIPRSARRERIEENYAIFDFTLTADEISRIDGLKDRHGDHPLPGCRPGPLAGIQDEAACTSCPRPASRRCSPSPRPRPGTSRRRPPARKGAFPLPLRAGPAGKHQREDEADRREDQTEQQAQALAVALPLGEPRTARGGDQPDEEQVKRDHADGSVVLVHLPRYASCTLGSRCSDDVCPRAQLGRSQARSRDWPRRARGWRSAPRAGSPCRGRGSRRWSGKSDPPG